jgi:hypothetical protein
LKIHPNPGYLSEDIQILPIPLMLIPIGNYTGRSKKLFLLLNCPMAIKAPQTIFPTIGPLAKN